MSFPPVGWAALQSWFACKLYSVQDYTWLYIQYYTGLYRIIQAMLCTTLSYFLGVDPFADQISSNFGSDPGATWHKSMTQHIFQYIRKIIWILWEVLKGDRNWRDGQCRAVRSGLELTLRFIAGSNIFNASMQQLPRVKTQSPAMCCMHRVGQAPVDCNEPVSSVYGRSSFSITSWTCCVQLVLRTFGFSLMLAWWSLALPRWWFYLWQDDVGDNCLGWHFDCSCVPVYLRPTRTGNNTRSFHEWVKFVKWVIQPGAMELKLGR